MCTHVYKPVLCIGVHVYSTYMSRYMQIHTHTHTQGVIRQIEGTIAVIWGLPEVFRKNLTSRICIQAFKWRITQIQCLFKSEKEGTAVTFSCYALASPHSHYCLRNRCVSQVKQRFPIAPSNPDKWMDKLLHIHTMEYYSAIKRNTCSTT